MGVGWKEKEWEHVAGEKEEVDNVVLWSEIKVFLLCSNAGLMSTVL